MIVNIMFTGKWLENINNSLLKEFNISQQQFNILRILRGAHPNCSSMTMLQDRMIDKMSNASRLVEKLRLKGYVERKENLEDRREVKVTITDAGLNLLKTLDSIFTANEERFKQLTMEEAEILNNLLDKLRS